MKRKGRLLFIILIVVSIIGCGVYVYTTTLTEKEPVTYMEFSENNQNNEDSYFSTIFEQVKNSSTETRILLENSEVIIEKSNQTTTLGYLQAEDDVDNTLCEGAEIMYINIKNISESTLIIENEAFYLLINGEKQFAKNVLENAEYGKYILETFPIELQQGEAKDVFLAFEYSVPGKLFNYEATDEEKSAYRYEYAIYFNDEQLMYTANVESCVSTIREKN